jgi:hypothetical protein
VAFENDFVGGVFGDGRGESGASCVSEIFPGVLKAGVEFAA